MNDWPFTDAKDLSVLTVRSVLEGRSPIRLVAHDIHAGSWQFLDGAAVQQENAVVVSLHSVVQRDPSLKQLFDLPLGWIATRRDPSDPWRRRARRSS
ncbi:MAG TPA: hypothetical protein VNO21_19030 [Polyangiaceae bacterium]|nr:hypothetical protein [Polyangiaceae bacterium]